MKISISDSFEKMSSLAANDLIDLMQQFDRPLLCPASGDSPAGLYEIIANKVQQSELDISNWQFVGLDEWVAMNGEDEGSCRFHLNNQLFNPLQVSESSISFFDGRSVDLQQECEKIEAFIFQNGGIDIAVIGLGLNGHIGMNEPGASILSRSQVIALDPITISTGQKYFKKEQPLSEGITLGIKTILESKYIFLLVSGVHKSSIVAKVLEGEITAAIPGTALRNHPGFMVYLDQASASLLKTKSG